MSSITRINRDDMLELTRRMTIARTSMTRIAGSYMDADGFIDGTFNTNFLKLKNSEKERKPYYSQGNSVCANQPESQTL